MKRFMMAVMVVGLALASLLSGGQAVLAEEITCTGTLGRVTVDNLRVPPNASCTLDGTMVEGTIKVEDDASLTARGITVIGNIQAVGADTVIVLGASSVGGSIQAENTVLVKVLDGSTVVGNIQVKQGGAARVDQVQVNGDIQFESNNGAVSATRNRFGSNLVGGNVQVFQNKGVVNIVGNIIDGNLQCKENVPPPTGRDNVVHGNAEDQCANMAMPADTTPPHTIILAGPPGAALAFTGSDDTTPAELLLFECALNGSAFASCGSPYDV